MTPALKLAFAVGEVAAFLLGFSAAPWLFRIRAQLRLQRHCASCFPCRAVRASGGPAWLYCPGGRAAAGWARDRWLRAALRSSTGIPERRTDGN